MTQHGKRITDVTRGEQLGKHDYIVQWPRPPKPTLMSAEPYARCPAFIRLREAEVNGRIWSPRYDCRYGPTELSRVPKSDDLENFRC
jgi:hypothetical protein